MGNNPTVVTDSETPLSISRPPAGIGPGRVDRDSVCAADGNRLGRPTPGNGVWLRYDLLATVIVSRCCRGGAMSLVSPCIDARVKSSCTLCYWGAKAVFGCLYRLLAVPSVLQRKRGV